MSDLGAYALRFALLIAIAGLATAIHAGTSRREDWLRDVAVSTTMATT